MGEENFNNVYRGRKKMMFDNFLGGIAWSFGTIIGGTILLLIIGFFLSKIDFVPIIGGWVHRVVQEAVQDKPSPVRIPITTLETPEPSPTTTVVPSPSPLPTVSTRNEATSSAR